MLMMLMPPSAADADAAFRRYAMPFFREGRQRLCRLLRYEFFFSPHMMLITCLIFAFFMLPDFFSFDAFAFRQLFFFS